MADDSITRRKEGATSAQANGLPWADFEIDVAWSDGTDYCCGLDGVQVMVPFLQNY